VVVVDAAVQGASQPAFKEGHTAGLTQEAPIGENNELDPSEPLDGRTARRRPC
jgi:hypothetical protein